VGRYITADELMVRYPLCQTWHEGNRSHVESYIIYYAEAEVDARLGQAYSTPFAVSNPTVKDLSLECAFSRILWESAPDQSKDMRSMLDERFKALISGAERIVTSSGTLAPSGASNTVWSNSLNYNPTHSMLDPENAASAVDSSMLTDEMNKRGVF
jgi:hypothetical protein